MEMMKHDLMLRKEGTYWTLYLGEYSLGCGDLEDMKSTFSDVADRLDSGESPDTIIEEFNDFR